jgi:hypothetical protein
LAEIKGISLRLTVLANSETAISFNSLINTEGHPLLRGGVKVLFGLNRYNKLLTCPHKSESLVEENKEEQIEMLPKKQADLRLQFIHRPIKKRWYARKYPFLIQNEPFEYGLKIKNIGSEPFSGATISEFEISSLSGIIGIAQKARSKPKIKALNPSEEFELYFDRYTFWHEGSISTSCTLIPDKDGEIIKTYQHHRDHNIDEPFKKENEWWHDYYCQGQQQLLQNRTNSLILLLTIITVIEAIFGLKYSLKFILSLLATALSHAVTFLQWLAS